MLEYITIVEDKNMFICQVAIGLDFDNRKKVIKL